MSSLPPLDAALIAPRKRKYHTHSDDVRATVLQLHDSHHSWSDIERFTLVPKRTAQHWVEQHDAEGRVSKKPRGGSQRVVFSASVRAQIVSAQEADAALRLIDLPQKIHQSKALPLPSHSTILRWLQAAGFTTKRMQPYATQRNSKIVKEKRKEWVSAVGSKLISENCVFIDESPFSMTLMRGCGRSKKGVAALGVVPAIRGKNHSVIAAISPTQGLLFYKIHTTHPTTEFKNKRKGTKLTKTGPKGVTRDIFRDFLIKTLALPFFHVDGEKRILLYDNAAIHKGDIDEVIFTAGHTPQPLTPWSPELNPIEYAFSTWKLNYRTHYPATEEEVDPAIKASADSITPIKCMNWFEHTKHLYADCLALEDL